MCWHVCTQYFNLSTVTVKDGKETHLTIRKTNTSTKLQHLAQGSTSYGGTNRRVEIAMKISRNLDVSSSSAAILDESAHNVGYVYDCCVEDRDDRDYNDFSINTVSCRKME